MIEKNILEALQQKAITSVAASTIPTLPIAFVDVSFNPPNTGKYLELVHIPNNPTDQTWGDEEVHRGIFRMILHWPSNGGGGYPPRTVLDSIASSWSKGTKVNGLLQILNKPKAGLPIKQGNENLYTCTVEYSVFTIA